MKSDSYIAAVSGFPWRVVDALFHLCVIFFNILLQLQHIVSKDVCWQVVDVFESSNKSVSLTPTEYQKKVEDMIADENCFKIVTVRNAPQMPVTHI